VDSFVSKDQVSTKAGQLPEFEDKSSLLTRP
jgi:hypothetical protein